MEKNLKVGVIVEHTGNYAYETAIQVAGDNTSSKDLAGALMALENGVKRVKEKVFAYHPEVLLIMLMVAQEAAQSDD